MQSTLLTIAIAVILALVAALVAPFVIDWNGYRDVVEREATRLTGLETRVAGPIEVRFLPSPRVALSDASVGDVAARNIMVELSLGSLVRGEWRATDIGIVGPKLELALDRAGKLSLPLPRPNFGGGDVAVERLHIEDGSFVVTDAASGTRFTLDGVWFTGDARTLAGPYRGEGAFQRDGSQYPFRLFVARPGDDGKSRVRLNIDPTDRPLSLEADGDLTLVDGVPRFEGSASAARPVQLVALRGATTVTQPWRASAKVKASSASALLEQIEFNYGSEEQGVKLNGTADVKFGAQPRIEGVLSARQVDLDRALSNADGMRLLPAAAIRTLAQSAAGVLPFPFRVGVGIDSVTLGGANIASLRGDIESAGEGWRLSGFEFRAPGFSRVQLAGALAPQANGVSFAGRADIDSTNLAALLAWIEGRADGAARAARSLKAQGDVTFASDRLAVERLRAVFDRETVEGRLDYRFASAAQGARLDAELRASELDLDGAQGFLAAALAGSALERPQDITLSAAVGRATVAGISARELQAKIVSDKNGIQIERLAAADLGGAAFSAGGRIALTPSPRGGLTADIDARDIAGVATMIARYWPAAAPRLREIKGASKLRAVLELGGDSGGKSPGTLTLNGNAGALRGSVNVQATTALASLDVPAFEALSGRMEARIEADNTAALLALTGLNAAIAATKEPGQFTFTARGPWRGEWNIDGKLTGGPLDLAASGSAQPFAAKPQFALNVTAKNADLRQLVQLAAPLPVSGTGRLAYDGERVSLTDASASLAGSNLRGNVSVALTAPRRIEGDVVADTVNAAAVLGAISGFPVSNTTEAWPIDPFRPGVATDYTGVLKLRSARATFTPALNAREFATAIAFGGNGASFRDLAGEVAGGKLGGELALERNAAGLRVNGRVTLGGADAATLTGGGARPAIAGRVTLDVTAEGAGLSPSALMGSLKGSGTVLIEDGKFAALDPRVFAAVTQAVDRGLPVDNIRIRDATVRALDAGDLAVKRADATVQIANGQVRLQDAVARTDAGSLGITGRADLAQATIDARMTLSGPAASSGPRPDIFIALRGPWLAPARSVDVSALTGWLTLRAIDAQAKKLETLENATTPRAAPPAQSPPPRN